MPKKKLFEVAWTENAFKNAIEISYYLNSNFTNKEVIRFYTILSAFESAVAAFPNIYPSTKKHSKVHRAVLSKFIPVFYRVKNSRIEVVAILDNRNSLTGYYK